jgi:multidrug resistance efflux pump
MATPFVRSLRSLSLDGRGRSTIAIGVAIAVLAAWAGWAFGARVTVYETSSTARLETAVPPHRVSSPVAARIEARLVELGDEIAEGTPLVRLESTEARLALAAAEARRDALDAELEPLESELAVAVERVEEDRETERRTLSEADAERRAAEATARLARERYERVETLAGGGAAPASQRAEAEVESLRDQSSAEAARFAIGRLRSEHRARQADARARVEAIRHEIEETRGQARIARAEIERLRAELERRLVRSPCRGRVAQIASIPTGTFVGEGDLLLTVVPEGELRVVAHFPPGSALGRIARAQDAEVRLDAFPWTQYGTLDATVERVADEIDEEGLRVELLLVEADRFPAPLAHGLPGRADVAIEEVAPIVLLLRATTPWFEPRAEAAPLARAP